MTADASTSSYLLKEWYVQKRLIDLTYVDNTAFALVKKVEKFEGSGIPMPMLYATPQGAGRLFSQAQTRSQSVSSSGIRPVLTPVQDYSIATIDGQLIRRTKTDAGAFLKGALPETDGAITTLKCSLAQKLFRDGYGAIGVIATAGISGSTITLSPINDAVNFAKDMQVVFAATNAASTLRNAGGTLTVSAVNTATGVITFTAAVGTLAAVAAGDSIFRASDRQDSATPARLTIAGLEAWCPSTAPAAAESYFGADRSVYPSRLAGQRKDMTGSPIEEALIEGAVMVGNENGKIDTYFCNYNRWSQLQKALMTRGVVDISDVMATPKIGFKAINVIGPSGTIKILADANCPNNRLFGVKMSSLTLYSTGPAVQPLDEDGNIMLRVYNADAYEVRYGFFGNLACDEPKSLCNVQV